jgi:hypothetical protein
MVREFPAARFERYCDDVIVHAHSERRMPKLCGPRSLGDSRNAPSLNERKTRIVYCKSLYNDLGGDYFARRDPTTKRLIAQLERLGHHVTLHQAVPA